MKKIMMIAAVTALAGLTQAAQITWGSSSQNIRTANDSGLIAAGKGVVQLIYVSGAIDVGTGLYGTEVLIAEGLVGDGAVKPLGGKYVGTPIFYLYGISDLGTGQTINNGDLFIIRVWDAPTVAGAGYMWNSNTFGIGAVDDTGGDTFYLGGTTTATGEWYPIPEPATASLLAIGIAAIALRRRMKV